MPIYSCKFMLCCFPDDPFMQEKFKVWSRETSAHLHALSQNIAFIILMLPPLYAIVSLKTWEIIGAVEKNSLQKPDFLQVHSTPLIGESNSR